MRFLSDFSLSKLGFDFLPRCLLFIAHKYLSAPFAHSCDSCRTIVKVSLSHIDSSLRTEAPLVCLSQSIIYTLVQSKLATCCFAFGASYQTFNLIPSCSRPILSFSLLHLSSYKPTSP